MARGILTVSPLMFQQMQEAIADAAPWDWDMASPAVNLSVLIGTCGLTMEQLADLDGITVVVDWLLSALCAELTVEGRDG
jgi:hypothetical protein